MTRVKMTAAAAIAVCAFGVAAGPAMAAEFQSTGGATQGSGEEQYIQLPPFKISCEKARLHGDAPAGASQTITAEIKFKKCVTAATIGSNPISIPTHFKTPFDVEYHANGFVEVGSELEGAEPEATLRGGTVELKVAAIHCEIYIPTQTLPVKAVKKPEGEYADAAYSNETYTRGKKSYTRLEISNEFTKIHYEYGEGQCEEFKKAEEERNGGKYEGSLSDEVAKGNLEFVDLVQP